MNKKILALAVSAGLAMPGLASAIEVAGKALQIYGQVHVSVDSVSGNEAANKKVSNVSVSSNSSRLGFKGEGDIGSMTGFYKIEGSISADNSGGIIDHRAAYVGLEGSGGSLTVGYRDTIYKDIFGKFDIMGNSIGDSRNILGSTSNGKEPFDTRAKNGIIYSTPKMNGLQANFEYATAFQANTTGQAGQDNNNNALTAANVTYAANGLSLAAAWEQQDYPNAAGDAVAYKLTGTRLYGGYKVGAIDARLIYEQLDDSAASPGVNKRNAYGAAVVYSLGGPGAVKLQYMKAEKSSAGNDGANQITVGYDYKLAKNASAYIMYDKVSNDPNAQYFIGAGHDQHYTTVAGKDVSAISVGYVYKF